MLVGANARRRVVAGSVRFKEEFKRKNKRRAVYNRKLIRPHIIQ